MVGAVKAARLAKRADAVAEALKTAGQVKQADQLLSDVKALSSAGREREAKAAIEAAQLTAKEAGSVKTIDFSDLTNMPHPLEHYLGHKRSMLQSEAYNGIVPEGTNVTRVVDVYGGSGLLGFKFQRELKIPLLINDANPRIANFHLVVQQQPHELLSVIRKEVAEIESIKLRYTSGGQEGWRQIASYWESMQSRLQSAGNVERAAGVYMIHGPFGTTRGTQRLISGFQAGYSWRPLHVFDELEQVILSNHRLLQGAQITSIEDRLLLRSLGPRDLALLDPPYVPQVVGRTRVRGYPVGQDLGKIENALAFINRDVTEANRRGIPMIITNNCSPRHCQGA